MSFDKDKIWTQAELDEWAARREVVNAQYRAVSDRQIKEWVKGNSIHNSLSAICAVVDCDEKIVGYIQTDGPECCPDFSCCGVEGWPIEQRQKFAELRHSGNEAATHEMLMGSLSSLVAKTDEKIYIAGQAQETIH